MAKENFPSKAQEEVAATVVETVDRPTAPPMIEEELEIIYNSYKKELYKGSKRFPSAWRHAPAILQLLKAAANDLGRIATMRGSAGSVRAVRAAVTKDHRFLFIHSTVANDPEAIKVRRYGGRLWINLISLFGPSDHLAVGVKERFDVHLVERSPVGPALMIDLTSPVEVKESRPGSRGSVPAPVGQNAE